jgi:hypothetical protein
MMKVYGNIETGQIEFQTQASNGATVTMTMSVDTAEYYAELITATAKVMRKHQTESEDDNGQD